MGKRNLLRGEREFYDTDLLLALIDIRSWVDSVLNKLKFWWDFKGSSTEISFVTIDNYGAIKVHKEADGYGVCPLFIQVEPLSQERDELMGIIRVNICWPWRPCPIIGVFFNNLSIGVLDYPCASHFLRGRHVITPHDVDLATSANRHTGTYRE
ncbi:hypothetical protein ES708_32866 [subsurface metagenome]